MRRRSSTTVLQLWLTFTNRGVHAKIIGGSVAEWLKAHDSKSCGRVDRLGGSNPLASARKYKKETFRSHFYTSSTEEK